MSSSRRLIAVCGESDPQTPVADIAFELGKGIAERGAVLICGVCRYEMPILVSSGPAAIMEEAGLAAVIPAKTYPVTIENGDIYVEVAD